MPFLDEYSPLENIVTEGLLIVLRHTFKCDDVACLKFVAALAKLLDFSAYDVQAHLCMFVRYQNLYWTYEEMRKSGGVECVADVKKALQQLLHVDCV